VALSNTTLGALLASINTSIMLIALPDVFRGIGIDPIKPGNGSLLLWLIMGYLVVTAVLVVSFRRLGDMVGRVRIYTLGLAVFTVFSVLLAVTWLHGTAGALWLIVMRVPQGVGGAMLMANSSAILTDAFPSGQRARAGPEPGGRGQRAVHRPGARRPARAGRVAPGVRGIGSVRRLRRGLGLPDAA
jgi:MFS family permease